MVRSIYGGYEADKPASELKAPEGMRRPQRPVRSQVSLNSLTIDQLCELFNLYNTPAASDRDKRVALRLELDNRIDWPKYE